MHVTLIQPDQSVTAGRIPKWLAAEGHTYSTIALWTNDNIPSAHALGDAVIILGGTMAARAVDEYDWIPFAYESIREIIAEKIPTLGICLGAQLAGVALAGQVECPAHGMGEEGIVTLQATPEGCADPWLGGAIQAGISAFDGAYAHSFPVPVSHDDAVTKLPDGAVLLATSQECPIHAWRYGSFLAVQHHPEASPEILADWAAQSAFKEGKPGHLVESIREKTFQDALAVDSFSEAFGKALILALFS